MKIALIHDFLTQLGGAERVLDALHEIFPKAPVYTIVCDSKKTFGKYNSWNIITSFIQKLPGGIKYYKWYLALMPWAVNSFDLSEYDLIFSDASAYAKGVRRSKTAKHICYCHTPTRYLWQMQDEYVAGLQYPWIIKKSVKPLLALLKKWDFRAAHRVDQFIANSKEVQRRIKKYYRKDSMVIYPPINTDFFEPAESPTRNYFLAVGRLESYKKMDLVIEAFNRLGEPLKLAGSGAQTSNLKSKIINPNIEFLGRISDEKLRELYQNAKAFIFPALEDAGMMMLESLACGTPVIAYGDGGALEFITPGIHGELFQAQNAASLEDIVKIFDHNKYRKEELVKQAAKFSRGVFKEKILNLISHLKPVPNADPGTRRD